jgi:predicted nucleic acid-binding protein
MTPRGFLDSNVLIYAVTDDPRATIAQNLLAQGCATSVQGLNEFAHVARRKLGMTWGEIGDALDAIRTLCPTIALLDMTLPTDAIRLADRYGFGFYDALMIAAALRLSCETFWSEDMQHGMIVDKTLAIENPFR